MTRWQPTDPRTPSPHGAEPHAPLTLPPLTSLSSPTAAVNPGPPFAAEPAGRPARTPVAGDEWHSTDPDALHPRSAMDVLSGLADKVSRGAVAEYQPIALGLTPLDRMLGGGVPPASCSCSVGRRERARRPYRSRSRGTSRRAARRT